MVSPTFPLASSSRLLTTMAAPPTLRESGNFTSATPTLHDQPVDIPMREKSQKHPDPEGEQEKSTPEAQRTPSGHAWSGTTAEDGDPDVLIVDWDGPNDPENPKK